MIIYCVTNRLNNKKYIGQTSRSLEERFREHIIQRDNCRGISGAIRKYGKENFKIEQIDTASSIEELNEREIYWIKRLNTKVPIGGKYEEGSCNYVRWAGFSYYSSYCSKRE
jgi:group I intron endonuclease